MTTIAALSVRLGMDASGFSDGVNLARSEVNKVSRIIQQAIPPHIKMRRELDLLEKAFSAAGRKTPTYAAAVQSVIDKYGPLTDKAKKAAAAQKELEKAQAEAAAKAAKVAEEGQRLTLAMLSAQERHNRSVSEYNKLLKAGAIDQVTYRRAVEQSRQALEGTNNATIAATSATSQMLGKLKVLAASYIGFQTITKSIKLATEIEDTTVAFEVLTGNVNDARVLFDQVRRFAAASPVTFSNAAQATRTLMSFGIEAQRIQPILRMLSDVTGGNNERFKMLSLAFAQMSAAGRLMGQDLLQMINSGFNPLQQISKTTGESLIDLKKRMEEGAVSSEEVYRAFEAATAQGGMFHGMTERLAQTMGGKLNIAMSDLEKAMASLGEAISPLIISMTDGFEKNKSLLNDLVFLVEKFADGAGFAAAAVKDWIGAITDPLNFSAAESNVNRLLNTIRQRDLIRERQKRQQPESQFQAQANAAKQAAALREKQRKEMEEATKAEQKKRDELAKQQAKHAADRLKEIERLQKAKDAAFTRDVKHATEAAKAYFAAQRKMQEDRRKQIIEGPKAADVGTAEAAKVIAEQYNRLLAARMPAGKEPTEQQLIAKVKELLQADMIARKEQERLAMLMKQATETMLATRPKLAR